MKLRLYIWLAGVLVLTSCGKDQVGFLDASEGRYAPDFMEVRNIPLCQEKAGWASFDEYIDNLGSDDPVVEIYIDDMATNWGHYMDSIPWIGKPMQAILGTVPMRVTLADVVSPDGGDCDLFRQRVEVWGDGTVQVPALMVPEGSYIMSFEVSNEGNRVRRDSAFTVKVIGGIPDKNFMK